MKLLLDTHVFLWAIQQPEELSAVASVALQKRENQLFLSLATIWEIQIKSDLGKLDLAKPLAEMVQEEIDSGRMRLLTILPEHVYALASLPAHHRDPFDRLLIAQAQVEEATLVTKDPLIAQYSVPTLW